MKNAASCETWCELQDTLSTDSSNAHCALGSSLGFVCLRVGSYIKRDAGARGWRGRRLVLTVSAKRTALYETPKIPRKTLRKRRVGRTLQPRSKRPSRVALRRRRNAGRRLLAVERLASEGDRRRKGLPAGKARSRRETRPCGRAAKRCPLARVRVAELLRETQRRERPVRARPREKKGDLTRGAGRRQARESVSCAAVSGEAQRRAVAR